MNWADYGILAIVILSILIGLLRGFTREIFGLGTWILAILLAVLFGAEVAQALQSHVATPLVRVGLAYGGLFLAGLLIGGILTALLVSRIRQSRFSSVDRTLGTGLGLVRGVLVVGLVVLLARTVDVSKEAWWNESALIGPWTVVADGLDTLIPDSWLEPLKPDPKPVTAPAAPPVKNGTGAPALVPAPA
jgi:membrane protein required for colicin V production